MSITAAFLLSGAAGLVYEVVWSRYLSLFIGGTALAQTIVLATFMGGLAAGNAIFGARVDKTPNKLRLYALLEVGIGLSCLLFPVLIAWLGKLYILLGAWAGPTSAINPILKVGLSVAAMLLPCVLMGGTLPVLARYITDSLSGFGVRLGWLYFLNTAGAMAGSLLGGFVVVERFGLELGMILTSFVNFAIAAVFYAFSRASGAETPLVAVAPQSAEPADAVPSVLYTERQARIAFVSIAVAGALTMLYEIVWFRLLVLSIGGTVHSFSTMLAGFIAGISAGSYLASRLMRRRRNALALFAACELGIAIVTLLPFALFERLPVAFYAIGSSLVHTPGTYPVFQACAVAVAIALMGPPAVFMGAALPFACRVCVDRLDRVGRKVGQVFSVNTIGNVVGTLVTGLVILPGLGLERTLLLGSALSAALGLALLWAWRPHGRVRLGALRDIAVADVGAGTGARLWPAVLVVMAGLVGFRVWRYPAWNPSVLHAGLYRWEAPWGLDPSDFGRFKQFVRDHTAVLYARDGMDASVMVESELERRASVAVDAGSGRGLNLALKINGKADASTHYDLATQLFVGHLPALLHPRPRDVMVVGLGSGSTAGALLKHPEIRVEVAEILPEVVEAARHFGSVNNGLLSNPRASIATVDARELLLLTRRQYDVIVSEPTNVWIPGVSLLFTQDFYDVVRSRLKPSGVFCQWLHLYASDRRMVGSTLTSLARTFSWVTLWSISTSDVIFVASMKPPPFDPQNFHDRFRRAAPAAGVPAGDPAVLLLADPVLFLSTQFATHEGQRLLGLQMGAPPYRDLFPRMEFTAARAQFLARAYDIREDIDERRHSVGPEPLFLERYLARFPLGDEDRRRLSRATANAAAFAPLRNSLLIASTPPEAAATLPGELAGTALLARALEEQIRDAGSQPGADVCLSYLEVQGHLLGLASSVLARPSTEKVQERAASCITANPAHEAGLRAQLISVLAEAGDDDGALASFRRFAEKGDLSRLAEPDRLTVLVTGARLLVQAGDHGEARRVLARALDLDLRAATAEHHRLRGFARSLAAGLARLDSESKAGPRDPS